LQTPGGTSSGDYQGEAGQGGLGANTPAGTKQAHSGNPGLVVLKLL
jgi:hypothetical protein